MLEAKVTGEFIPEDIQAHFTAHNLDEGSWADIESLRCAGQIDGAIHGGRRGVQDEAERTGSAHIGKRDIKISRKVSRSTRSGEEKNAMAIFKDENVRAAIAEGRADVGELNEDFASGILLEPEASAESLARDIEVHSISDDADERPCFHLQKLRIPIDEKALVNRRSGGVEEETVSSGRGNIGDIDVELTIELRGDAIRQNKQVAAGIGQGKNVIRAI